MKNEFLEKLAQLCEEYKPYFYYTIDDDGIHIDLNDEEIFIGFIDAEKLREAIK